MTDTSLQNYKAYVYRMHKLLLLGGVLHTNTIHPFVSCGAAVLTNIVSSGMCFAVLNFCWSNIRDLGKVTKGLSFACSLIATCLKATCFMINRKDIIELQETLGELFDEELKSSRRGVLLSLQFAFDKLAYTYSTFVILALFSYNLPPVITIVNQYVHQIEPKKYLLPFPTKFPWSIDGGGFIYFIHYLFEIGGSWCLYFTNNGADAVFGFYIFHIAAMLKTMTYQLKNPEVDEDRLLLLRSCMKKHKRLLRCRDIVQNVFGPVILWMVLTNAVAMCALIFQAFQTQMTYGKAAQFAFYMFLKLVQTFMYAWCGSALTAESEKFLEGLYFSDWLGPRSTSMKCELIVAMIQRPMTITASKICFVSVDMFSKILNTTMSYFFLLQSLDESG